MDSHPSAPNESKRELLIAVRAGTGEYARRMRPTLTVAALAAGAALCTAAPAAADSGIRGLVTISGHCGPVVQGQPPDPVAPFDADVLVRAGATHKLVATARSGRDGRWSVRLRPGRYLVAPGRARTGYGYTKQPPVRVTITRVHRWPRVDFGYDNGCR